MAYPHLYSWSPVYETVRTVRVRKSRSKMVAGCLNEGRKTFLPNCRCWTFYSSCGDYIFAGILRNLAQSLLFLPRCFLLASPLSSSRTLSSDFLGVQSDNFNNIMSSFELDPGNPRSAEAMARGDAVEALLQVHYSSALCFLFCFFLLFSCSTILHSIGVVEAGRGVFQA